MLIAMMGVRASWAALAPFPHLQAELVSEIESIRPGEPFTVALRLVPETHWHTYWKNPGDSGLAPVLTWELPAGFQAGEIQWLAPQRIAFPPLMNYGYEGESALLVEIRPPADLKVVSAPILIKLRAQWLVCADICVPGTGTFELKVPVKAESPRRVPALTKFFSEMRARRPEPMPTGVTFQQNEQGLKLRIPTTLSRPTTAYFYPEDGELIAHEKPQVLSAATDGSYLLSIPAATNAKKVTEVRGVLAWGTQNWEVAATLEAPVSPIPGSASTLTLGVALGFSFLGGLILNLMPCVLPVLSLKILGFVQQAGADRKRTWPHGAAFAVGVLISFWFLAALLLALRAAGSQIGWGFQLQSPLFVAGLAILFLLISLNLWGVFEVGLSMASWQAKADAQEGLAGSFSSGILATIVATPCTAPFMSSALGFAAAQPATVAFLIFTTLGLGMATPYVLLSIFPQALRWVPRPGRWMESLKQFLAFPLLATVAGLVWVFGQQTGNDGVVQLLLALVFVGLAAWIYGRWSTSAPALVLTVFLGLVGVVWAVQVASVSRKEQNQGEEGWERFSPERLAQLRSEGKSVFVDFTASWCLTCQVNKRIALRREEVLQKFKAKGVILMEADWTQQDAVITQALAAFGRNGVPVYALYAPGRKVELLPEILTPQIVLDALEKLP
jgi:thiol:disulfide interchange protein DsbD